MITDITVARQIMQERWPELEPSIMVNWHEDYDYPFWMLRLYKSQSATCSSCNHYEPKTDIATSIQTNTFELGLKDLEIFATAAGYPPHLREVEE